MPNGKGPAIRTFTKLMKVTFSILREQKLEFVTYADDFCLQGIYLEEWLLNVATTVKLLRSLGYIIHADKKLQQHDYGIN